MHKERRSRGNEGRKAESESGGEDREIREMQQQITLSGRSDCSVMEGEIGEEASSSAHRSAGAGITLLAITPDCLGANHAGLHTHK